MNQLEYWKMTLEDRDRYNAQQQSIFAQNYGLGQSAYGLLANSGIGYAAGLENMNKPPRQRKLEAAKAWLREHGSHPGCLQRFMKRREMA